MFKAFLIVCLCAGAVVEGRSHGGGGGGGGGWSGGSSGNSFSSHNHQSGGSGGGGRPCSKPSSTTAAPVSSTSSTTARSTTTTAAPATQAESRSMNQLYQAALAEGGHLVVYAGGDAPEQADFTKEGFEARFPGIKMDVVVDLSKYHGPRIDYQLETNSTVFDVAHLQTLQDYPRWKAAGVLLNYKPIDWDKVYPQVRDQDGAYTAIAFYSFSPLVNHKMLPNNASWPREARDFLRPEFKNQIVASYPNDDDAIMFWYKQIVDKYGWTYMNQLKAQNVTFVRSSAYPADWVNWGRKPIALLTASDLLPTENSTLIIPSVDPFITWPQTAAIFKASKNPATAKLYMSWLLEKEQQGFGWSVRSDMPAPAGAKSIWAYPNTDPTAFGRFMEDREAVESFKGKMTLIFGEVQGSSPTGELGTHPVKAIAPIPH